MCFECNVVPCLQPWFDGKFITSHNMLLLEYGINNVVRASFHGHSISDFHSLLNLIPHLICSLAITNFAYNRYLKKSGYANGHTTAKGPSASAENSPVISEPILVSTHSNGVNSELDKGNSSNSADASLISPISIGANNQGIAGPVTSDDQEKFKEEQAAIKAQAAFRGFLARRAFCALKGIIRLQALVRGHLVRRQAVVTLHSTLGIIKLQALIRGKNVRASGIGLEVSIKFCQGKAVVAKHLDSRNGKMYPNAFVCKVLSSSLVIMPLRIQYEQGEPNSVFSWMQRWTFFRFWKPPSQPKKTINSRSQTKRGSYAMETESGRPKRGVWRNSPTNVDTGPSNVTSESEKPKQNLRKVTASADSVQDHLQSELEKVKRNLRKVSTSYAQTSNKQEIEIDTQSRTAKKIADSQSDAPKEVIDDFPENTKKVLELSPEPKPEIGIPSKTIVAEESVDRLDDNPPMAEANPSPSIDNEENISVVNEALSVKLGQTCNENQKTSKRRASFSTKSEYAENIAVNPPTLPSYMQATESAKAKLRGQNSPRFSSDSAEKNGVTRRHSLPSSTNGKVTSHSPRMQRILQASGKGSIRSDRSLLSSRDANEKLVQVEWRR